MIILSKTDRLSGQCAGLTLKPDAEKYQNI